MAERYNSSVDIKALFRRHRAVLQRDGGAYGCRYWCLVHVCVYVCVCGCVCCVCVCVYLK